jgi:phosphonate transport system ATP-binding protein
MIHLEAVVMHRGQAEVLHGVSVDFPAGAITAVVGRSGVGKTTLLGALNGLLPPSSGSISVAGIGELGERQALQEHRRQTATVFQEHALIDRLSALDNVLLGLAERRHPLSPLPWPQEFLERAALALQEVGLLAKANQRVSTLSGGERQRVGGARALVRKPRLLLGDEPFSSVDPALVRQLGDTLREQVAQSGVTVVLVMHQIETALAMADKVVALVDGQIAYDGPADGFDTAAQAAVFAA